MILKWVELDWSNTAIADGITKAFNLPTTRKSVSRALSRWGVERNQSKFDTPRFTQEDDSAEIVNSPTTQHVDTETLLREHGLDPDDWEAPRVKVNRWDSGGEPQHQLTVNLERKEPLVQILAPRSEGWKPPKRARVKRNAELVVIVGDQQAPFHDPTLHKLFCEWLRENNPDRGISLGDSVDFPDISRHQLDPENRAMVNECLQSGYDLFRGYVDASPATQWQKLYGNHDERIRNLLLDKPKNQGLYGIKRPDTPEEEGEELLELSHAMRLDELGIEVIMPHGSYKLGQINISPKLAVRHGWIAQKGSGKSALTTLEHLGYSVIVGHTHRSSIVHNTKHEIDGEPRTTTAAEAGCMCRLDQTPLEGRVYPNYTPAPDWQQGFATATIWPDGTFKIDLATYFKGNLLYRDERYT